MVSTSNVTKSRLLSSDVDVEDSITLHNSSTASSTVLFLSADAFPPLRMCPVAHDDMDVMPTSLSMPLDLDIAFSFSLFANESALTASPFASPCFLMVLPTFCHLDIADGFEDELCEIKCECESHCAL